MGLASTILALAPLATWQGPIDTQPSPRSTATKHSVAIEYLYILRFAQHYASDLAANDQFGADVAIDGDLAVVGSPYDDWWGDNSGSAYVFRRDGASWSESTKLLPDAGATDDEFGVQVACDGDTILVGAIGDDEKAQDAGAAFVFRFDGTRWAQGAKLLASDGTMTSSFGIVDLQGDLAVVGAPRAPAMAGDGGAVYVFERSGTAWSEIKKLVPADPSNGKLFGSALALDGDTLLIGAFGDSQSTGSAYVFERDGQGWKQRARLVASDGGPKQSFGSAVALEGDTAVVGAPRANTSQEYGHVYVFVRDRGAWKEHAILGPTVIDPFARFGSAVCLHERMLAVGASDHRSGGGAVYLFGRSGAQWIEQMKFTSPTARALGCALDVSRDWVLAGARTTHGMPGTNSVGSVFTLQVPEAPDRYCTAKVNSCGAFPGIFMGGAPSASATSGFILHGAQARANRHGLLIYTDAGRRLPAQPFGQGGYLCIAAPVRRTTTVISTGGTAGACGASFLLDMNAFSAGQLGGSPQPFLSAPGARVACQWWGRDDFFHGSYLTDALEYTVHP